MKRVTLLSIVLGSIAILSGCVESSKKYKTLLAKTDSLTAVANAQNAEMESLLAGLNEISAGMQSIREAEHFGSRLISIFSRTLSHLAEGEMLQLQTIGGIQKVNRQLERRTGKKQPTNTTTQRTSVRPGKRIGD